MAENGAGSSWGPPSFDAPSGGAEGAPSMSPAPAGPPTVQPAGPPAAPASAAPLAVGSVAPQMSFDTADQPQGRRSKVAVGAAVVGVLAVGAAGVFAVGQFGADDVGGAASPEAVGLEMMSAIEQEDMLGVIDLLLPGERDAFREPLIEMVSELTRLEVLSADASLSSLSGLDIDMTNEAVVVEPTNVADISNITMSAITSASLDGDQLPIGDFITDLAGDSFDPNTLDEPTTTEDFEVSMTVVEDDGQWYLSVMHTAAEAARGELGEPIPDTGIEPRGGATPEGAIDVLLDGVEQLDIGKIIAGVNPNEAAALQRYAPLFLDSVAPMADDTGLDWQVTRSEYDVEGSGSKRLVTVTDLRIDGTFEGSEFYIEFTNGCVVAEAEGERIDSCEVAAATGNSPTVLDDFLSDSLDLDGLRSVYEEVFADYSQPGITVREVDGQWFVSPIGTGFDQVLALLRALDREELDRLVETTTDLVADLGAQLGPVFGEDLLPSDPTIDIAGGDVDVTDTGDVDVDVDLDGEAFEAEQQIIEACYGLEDADELTTCLVDAVEAGQIPEYYVGPELQFPECGLADVALGRVSVFDLSNEEYTTIVEVASTCFADLIASGALEADAVTPEYLRPDCAEGQNPWTVDDDSTFFDSWIECIYAVD